MVIIITLPTPGPGPHLPLLPPSRSPLSVYLLRYSNLQPFRNISPDNRHRHAAALITVESHLVFFTAIHEIQYSTCCWWPWEAIVLGRNSITIGIVDSRGFRTTPDTKGPESNHFGFTSTHCPRLIPLSWPWGELWCATRRRKRKKEGPKEYHLPVWWETFRINRQQ